MALNACLVYFYKLFFTHSIIGHWIPQPEQIRYIDKNPAFKPQKSHILSDFLLIKYLPKYGYLWNKFFSKVYGLMHTFDKFIIKE